MIYIANPIYDSVFKYLMEDDRAAKILLSALLGRKVVDLQLRRNEYSNTRTNKISIFRIDFAAKVEDENGTTHLVLIELQKTWLETETLRFRQYLGVQYSSPDNMMKDDDGNDVTGIPIVAIYLLGHRIDNSGEPIIYVRRTYLNSNNEPIKQYENEKNAFIESLTHDSIIVQIPELTGKARNHVERIMNVFDQSRCTQDPHLLSIDDETALGFNFPDEQHLRQRLLMAGTDPDVRQKMNVEDEILSEVEKRDTLILQKDLQIEQKNLQIEQKDLQIEQKDQQIEQKDLQIEQKDKTIQQQSDKLAVQQNVLRNAAQMLMKMPGADETSVARDLGISIEDLRKLMIDKQ